MLTPGVSIFVFLAGTAAQTAWAAETPTFYRDILPVLQAAAIRSAVRVPMARRAAIWGQIAGVVGLPAAHFLAAAGAVMFPTIPGGTRPARCGGRPATPVTPTGYFRPSRPRRTGTKVTLGGTGA